MGRASLCNAQQDAQRLRERLPEELKHLPMRVGCAPVLGSCGWECREVTQGVLETDLSIQHLQGSQSRRGQGNSALVLGKKGPFCPSIPQQVPRSRAFMHILVLRALPRGFPKRRLRCHGGKAAALISGCSLLELALNFVNRGHLT